MLLLFLCVLAVHGMSVGALAWGWHRAVRSPSSERLPQKTPPIATEAAADGVRANGSNPDDPDADDPDADADLPPLSVVIALRDEHAHLDDLLSALDRQTHPNVEFVLVDDASTDATPARLAAWAADRSDVQRIRITQPQAPRKKHALARGIAAATHDLLAFTDADCVPPPEWLRTLAWHHRAHAQRTPARDTVLIGYSPMQRHDGWRGALLSAWARYETFLAGTYAIAAAGLGCAYTAVGRNLSYPKAVFERVGGFDTSGMSGDDDLFVQAVRRHDAAEVRAVVHPEAFVPTAPPDSWSAWLHQKRRHVSAGRAYDGVSATALTLMNSAGVLLWLAPLVLGATGLGLLAIGLLLRQLVLGPAAEGLRETSLLALFPLGEAAYALYHVLVVPIGLIRPPATWSAPARSPSPSDA